MAMRLQSPVAAALGRSFVVGSCASSDDAHRQGQQAEPNHNGQAIKRSWISASANFAIVIA